MKQPQEAIYSFQARIEHLRSALSPFSVDGTFVSAEELQVILNELEYLQSEAVTIRGELSTQRWNSRGQRDALIDEVIKQAMHGGNVVIFPVQPRPIPHTALQSGVIS